ncbi:bifunctional precorrin-2 dehydrogenase/sirohydrochlorin ferrochelatase [Reichenbachiella agarivorans]|uniref:precorrin-2 dehydrogenase n=1 Tax=Reichenbachiella agarivorans TaxID=2979464 RepID=A0ABY6CS29_9BACT|nr:bifunctional precorrin-2 dehydrogenase/sirohydrochlorin ferrochelatase [Reichenbachiella agarivorans]UXP33322.1 bifunctional precorrin-2 dehydrogenase/sirohydrochlorin ferrochelatase [Reichenbachiella agarivorans]
MSTTDTGNNLFPVFFKLEEMNLLIVGGGYVGWEKLSVVINNSPKTKIKLVAKEMGQEVIDLAMEYPNITLLEKAFEESDLEGINLVIVGINDPDASSSIQLICRQKNILVNVADKPSLCDFYLGSVVKKGDLKIAISTNGKSPTVAKRMRELLTDVIPDTIDEVLQNMTEIRDKLKGDFDYKVNKLNEITKSWKNGKG